MNKMGLGIGELAKVFIAEAGRVKNQPRLNDRGKDWRLARWCKVLENRGINKMKNRSEMIIAKHSRLHPPSFYSINRSQVNTAGRREIYIMIN
jgi:hypothetical protein